VTGQFIRTVSHPLPGRGLQVGMKSKVPPIPKHAEVEADPGVLARFNSSVIEEFRANGGVVGGPFEDSAVMLLTMTGARSGQPRLTPLEYFRLDGRVIFVGHTRWCRNRPCMGAQRAREP
jgi:hypothetical protein